VKEEPLGSLGYVRGLRSFLAFGDFELYLITFLQAFVALRSDRAVMNKYVWPICSSDEPVSLCIVEPLDGSFQTFHEPPSFCTSLMGGKGRAPVKVLH
jgi:hypothetical protein